LLGGICRGASFPWPGDFSPFPGFAFLSLAAILALMMVFPDLFFRRPLASLSTATMRDFSIAISCLPRRRVANGALEGPRTTIPRNVGIRKAEPSLVQDDATIGSFAFSLKIKASFAAPGPRSQIRDLGWRLPYSGYHIYDRSRRQTSAAFGLPVDVLRKRDAADNRDRVRVRGAVTTPRPRDRAHRPASSDARCRPSAMPRVPSVSGPQDSVRPR
jgi:hypothetical protein